MDILSWMALEELHQDVLQLVYGYLTQQDLFDNLLINRYIYQQIMEYISRHFTVGRQLGMFDWEEFGRYNLIIDIKLNWNKMGKQALQDLYVGVFWGGHQRLYEYLYKICPANSPNIADRKNSWTWHERALARSCQGGHLTFIMIAVAFGAHDWENGLFMACGGGDLWAVEYMIQKGACDWNHALVGASVSGSVSLIKWMIDKGARNFNDALARACDCKKKEAVKYLIVKCGAKECRACQKSMDEHLLMADK